MTACGAAIYGTLIRLYPHAFWREFHDELEEDFGEASAEARSTSRIALAGFWARALADLCVSLVREWLRTPWLPVLLIAGVVSVTMFALTALQVSRMRIPVPRRTAAAGTNAESLTALIVMIIGALVPIVAAILASMWAMIVRRQSTTQPRRRHV